jgi:hypothetical protein
LSFAATHEPTHKAKSKELCLLTQAFGLRENSVFIRPIQLFAFCATAQATRSQKAKSCPAHRQIAQETVNAQLLISNDERYETRHCLQRAVSQNCGIIFVVKKMLSLPADFFVERYVKAATSRSCRHVMGKFGQPIT